MPKKTLNWFSKEPFPQVDTYIVGIDPGVTTGVSVLGLASSNSVPLPSEVELWGSNQLSYGGSGNISDLVEEGGFPEQRIAKAIARDIKRMAKSSRLVVVAIEDFVIRKMNTSRDFLAPVRITSAIIQEIYSIDNVHLLFWSPADAKSVCTDKRMDLWGYEIQTKRDRHSRDADRHAVLTLRKIKERPSIVPKYLSLT